MKKISSIVKILAIMAVFGIFAMGMALYVTIQMRHIHDGHTSLTAHQVQEGLLVSRANKNLQTAHAAIINLLLARSDADNRASMAQLDEAREKFREFMDEASEVALTDGLELQSLKAQTMDVFDHACGAVISDGARTTADSAAPATKTTYLRDCAPKFPLLTEQLTAKTKALADEAVKVNDGLKLVINQAMMAAYGLILSGLAMAMIGGVFGIRIWLVLPLRSLVYRG